MACCKVSKEDLERMFLASFPTAEEAIADALQKHGKDATFMAIPLASEIIPVIEN